MTLVQLSSLNTMLIGHTGMLGHALVDACTGCGMSVDARPDHAALDITDGPAVMHYLETARPALVLNAAGYTDVDGAETGAATADRVNHLGPANLADACGRIGALLVHVSTDYVFDGQSDRPYTTTDTPNPMGVYGQSKLNGERAVLGSECDCLIIRTSWLYAPHGKNFVRTILELARQRETLQVVNDQTARPTFAPDLASMILSLIARGARGVHHAANAGQASWFDLAVAVVAAAQLSCTVTPCSTEAFPRPAARPAYSVLDLAGTTAIIDPPRHWSEAVEECVRTMLASADACSAGS